MTLLMWNGGNSITKKKNKVQDKESKNNVVLLIFVIN